MRLMNVSALAAAAAVVSGLSSASAQVSFVTANTSVSGVAQGTANSIPGTGSDSFTYNQSPSQNIGTTSGSGGTSGGLGDAPAYKAGFAELNVGGTIQAATLRSPVAFEAIFQATGDARFDAAHYNGSISAFLNMSGQIDLFSGQPPTTNIPYFFFRSGDLVNSFQLTDPNGIAVPLGVGTLHPGIYSFSFQATVGAGGAGRGSPIATTFNGTAGLILPTPGTAGLLVISGLIGALRRRRAV